MNYNDITINNNALSYYIPDIYSMSLPKSFSRYCYGSHFSDEDPAE